MHSTHSVIVTLSVRRTLIQSKLMSNYESNTERCTTVTSHGHHGVSSDRQLHCLLNRVFRLTAKKAPKLNITDPLLGESTRVTGGFFSQRASNAENVPWHTSSWPGILGFVWLRLSNTLRPEQTWLLWQTIFFGKKIFRYLIETLFKMAIYIIMIIWVNCCYLVQWGRLLGTR